MVICDKCKQEVGSRPCVVPGKGIGNYCPNCDEITTFFILDNTVDFKALIVSILREAIESMNSIQKQVDQTVEANQQILDQLKETKDDKECLIKILESLEKLEQRLAKLEEVKQQ